VATLLRLRNIYHARIRWTVNGKQKNKLISLRTKQKAKANRLFSQIQEREGLFRQGVIGIDRVCFEDIPAIDHLIDEFMTFLEVNQKSSKTIELYKFALNAFKEIFNGRDISTISRNDYNFFMQKMQAKYPNRVTLNIRLRSILAFLRWAVEFGKIERLLFPIKQVRVDSKLPRYFSNMEIERIFRAIRDNDILLARVKLHLATGMRLRELKTSNLEGGFIHVYKSKSGKERQIPITSETAFYFDFSKNQSVSDAHVSRMFTDVLKDLGLYELPGGGKRSFHCLRHTFACRKYFETKDIYYVCKLLGHHSVTVTEIYARFSIDKLNQDFGSSNISQSNSNGFKSEKEVHSSVVC